MQFSSHGNVGLVSRGSQDWILY